MSKYEKIEILFKRFMVMTKCKHCQGGDIPHLVGDGYSHQYYRCDDDEEMKALRVSLDVAELQ